MRELAVTDHAVIFDKPRGLSCVRAHEEDEVPAAVDLALAAFPELGALRTGRSMRPNEYGLLHRLDRDTSGCLAFARAARGYTQLRDAWRGGLVEKVYRAIVFDPGRLWSARPTPLTIDWPLANSHKSKKRVLVLDPDKPGVMRSVKGNPLPAITVVTGAREMGDDLYDLTLTIATGVRHQIRAHLAAMGTPLFNDPIYGTPRDGETYRLHAWKLGLPGEAMITAPLPEGW